MNEKPRSSAGPLVLELALLAVFAGFAAYSQWGKRRAQSDLLDAHADVESMRNEITHLQDVIVQQAAAEASRGGSLAGAAAVPSVEEVRGKGCLISDGSRLWLFVAYSGPGVVSGFVFGVDQPAPRLFADHLEVAREGKLPLQIPYAGGGLRAATPDGVIALMTRNDADLKGSAERVAAGFFTLEATLLALCGAPNLEAVLAK